MDTKSYIDRFNPCDEGTAFALKFETMQEVWHACERPDWLVFMATWNGNREWGAKHARDFKNEASDWTRRKLGRTDHTAIGHYSFYINLTDQEKAELCDHLRSLFPCPFND